MWQATCHRSACGLPKLARGFPPWIPQQRLPASAHRPAGLPGIQSLPSLPDGEASPVRPSMGAVPAPRQRDSAPLESPKYTRPVTPCATQCGSPCVPKDTPSASYSAAVHEHRTAHQVTHPMQHPVHQSRTQSVAPTATPTEKGACTLCANETKLLQSA